ncbi:hypothetical protein QBC41DRAFT_300626 [Cercophora samala]|uniref:Uncharacterized protein n=1 Tax=Cercophora samala TaxID=330535 RepID=A0AA39ZI25_9PEZI|nr:hypothetical protein QBC41DRAFT_300626 [Cercophora samala]
MATRGNILDLCSLCPGFDPSFFPPCNDDSNAVALNNLVLFFRAIHWFINTNGSRNQAKEIARALGNQGLYHGLKAIETKLLSYRMQYLHERRGPAYPVGLTDKQEYLLTLIDDINKFEKIDPSLGAKYRLADAHEQWRRFLDTLKIDGNIRALDNDTDSASSNSADKLGQHLPTLLKIFDEFEATGDILPSVFAEIRDGHIFIQRYGTTVPIVRAAPMPTPTPTEPISIPSQGQTNDIPDENSGGEEALEGRDSDEDSLFVT